MIIACDQCGTRFSLDEEAVFGKQVKIRCSECQHIFSVGPAPKGGLPPEALDISESMAASDAGGGEEEEDLGLPDLPELEGLSDVLAAADAGDEKKAGGVSDDELESDLSAFSGEPRREVKAPPPPPPKKAAPAKAAAKKPEALVEMEDLGLPDLDEDEDLGMPQKGAAEDEDLDLGLPELEEEAAQALTAMEPEAELDLGDLDMAPAEEKAAPAAESQDLDLGMGDLGALDEDELAASAPAAGGEESELGLPDFEMSEAEAQEDMEVSHAPAKKQADDLDLGELGGLSEEPAAAAPAAAADDMDLGLPDFEMGDAESQEDMEVSHAAPAKAPAKARPEQDMDLDLDLPELGDLQPEEAAGEMPEGELDLDLDMGLSFGEEEAVAAPPAPGGEDLAAVQEALAATGPEEGAREMDLSPEASMAGSDLDLGDLAAGDLGGDDLGLGALEPLEEETASADAGMGGELDFDLGELEDEPSPPPRKARTDDLDKTQVVEEGLEAEGGELDFGDLEGGAAESAGELDLGDLGAAPAEAGGELDLDMDLGDLEAAPEPVAEATGEMDLDMDLGDLSGLEEEKPAAGGGGDLDLGDLDISGGDGLDLAAAVEPGQAEAMDLDSLELTTDGSAGDEVELDLDMGETMDTGTRAKAMAGEPDLDINFDMDADLDLEGAGEETSGSLDGGVTLEMDSAEDSGGESTMEYDYERTHAPEEEAGEEGEEELPAFIPRPRPAINRPLFAALLVFLALGGAFGALTILHFMGMEVPILGGGTEAGLADSGSRGLVIMDDVKGYMLENHEGRSVIVVRGHVRNDYPEARSFLRIKAALYDQTGRRVGVQMLYAGNEIQDAQIRRLTENDVKEALRNRKGLQNSNVEVPPNTLLPFTAVFYDPPESLEDYTVEAQGSVPAGNAEGRG